MTTYPKIFVDSVRRGGTSTDEYSDLDLVLARAPVVGDFILLGTDTGRVVKVWLEPLQSGQSGQPRIGIEVQIEEVGET